MGKQIKIRLLIVLGLFSVLTMALLVRVAWIQMVDGEFYRKAVFEQQSRSQIISPKRGNIYDINGEDLAVSLPVATISADPIQVQRSKKDIEKLSQGISDILQIDKADILKKLKKQDGYELIERKVDKPLGDKLKTWLDNNKFVGISIDDDTKRFYPNKNLAAQIIGFTGFDNQGLDGIELNMEQYLKGQPGKVMNEVDAGGYELPFDKEKQFDVKDGLNVVLTIDENIQSFAEKALQKAIDDYKVLQGGIAIVMDPRTGDILAMVSKPDFDLNNPFAAPTGVYDTDLSNWKSLKPDEQTKILQETVWRNRAVNSTYEPGSTFKAITAAAGLEEGVIKPESEVIDAPVLVGGWTINCWLQGGHGRETFAEAVYNSCNPVFVKLSQTLGIDRFYNYVRAFGFFDKTGINLPGEASSLMHKKPSETNMATSAFGQTFQITPIQLITAYAAIANGGKLLQPRIVKELTDSQGNVVKKFDTEEVRNVISKQTSDTLRGLLEGVVSQGTGVNAYVTGYRVAGKTGTSQTFVNGVRSEDRYIASFSAFAPADNPDICVLVALDYPSPGYSHSGGTVAGPAAASIIEETLDYLGVERQYSDKDKLLIAEEIGVPDFRNKTVAEAKKSLAELKLDYKILGNSTNDNAIIADQTPAPYESVPENSTVVLYTNKGDSKAMVKVPDVMNKTIPEATLALRNAGLNIKVKGMGKALKQQYNAGTDLQMGKVVEVEFGYQETND